MGHRTTDDEDENFDDGVEQLEYCQDCGELTQDCVCDLLDEWD